MNDYRFHLEQYRNASQKHHCPACGQKRFVRYVDEQGNYIADEVGRCDRQDSCGYHLTPKQYFEQHPDLSSDDWKKNYTKSEREPEPPRPIDYIPDIYIQCSTANLMRNNLYRFFRIFGESLAMRQFRKYRVSTSAHWRSMDGKGLATAFPQIDVHGKIRQVKVIMYEPDYGHRLHENDPAMVQIAGTKDYRLDTTGSKVWFAGKTIMRREGITDPNLQQTYFGAHLIPSAKQVCIVESEKTAMIADIYYQDKPDMVWIATGGKNGCRWNTWEVSQVLQDTMVQSTGSTDTSYIGCYRGTYNETYTYYEGDEVIYTVNGVTSTYRCIVESVTGKEPTNSSYWQVMAAGVKGDDGTSVTIKGTVDSPDELPMSGNTDGDGYLIDGDLWIWDGTQWNDVGQIQGPAGTPANYYEIRYSTNGSPTVAPDIDNTDRTGGNNGNNWKTTMPDVPDGYYLWMTIALIDGETDELVTNWSTPVRISGEKGEDGKSPVMVFCGEYDPDTEYNGTDYRLDCVKYGDQYYIARIDAGTFKGIVPTETSKWNTFGASFESIATGLLLAEWANIGGWVFKGDILISQKGTVSGVESTDYENANFKPYVTLDGKQGKVYTGNGVTMDADGITLTDDSGNVVVKIVRESIGGETDLDGGTQEEEDRTYPLGGTDNRVKDQYWCSLDAQESTTTRDLFSSPKVIDLGRFNSTDDILNQVGAQLNAGTSVPTTGLTVSYAELTLEILKDGVVVETVTDRHNNIRDGSNLFADDYMANYSGNIISTHGTGSYSLRVTFSVTYSGSLSTANTFNAYLYTAYYYHKNGIKRTLIGTDGMYSCWGNNMYFRCAADGIRMRMGNYILRITDTNGIQARKDGEGSAFCL